MRIKLAIAKASVNAAIAARRRLAPVVMERKHAVARLKAAIANVARLAEITMRFANAEKIVNAAIAARRKPASLVEMVKNLVAASPRRELVAVAKLAEIS